MASALKQQAVKGIVWNLLERFGLQGIKLVLGVWLARLLTPADYGLVGMISVFFAVATVFVGSGFGAAYVQKKEVTDLDANTVFYSNLIISLVCYAGLWMAAPAIAKFYDQAQLVSLTRVMGVSLIINAFNMIQVAQLTRTIDFRRKTTITLTATLISGIAGILAALLGWGVWSLIFQQLLNRLLTTMGMWVTSSWRPALQFSTQSFHCLFSFGAWVLAASIVRAIFDNIYILIIGKFFPLAQLGFYTKAKRFRSLVAEQLAGSVGMVAFPVLSRMQDDPSRLRVGVRSFLTYTMAFTAPLIVTLMVVAKPFVLVLLTEKWAPVIPYIQLLCISGFLYPIHLVNVQVLQAQGRTNLNFRITVIKNLLRIGNISLMYRFGVFFIIIGEIVTSFIALAINSYYTRKLLNYGLLDQCKDIGYITFSVVAAGMVGASAVYAIPNQFVSFTVGVVITVGGYIILQYVFNRIFFLNLFRLKENFVK